MKTITLVNQMGGVTKSTSTVNLGVGLVRQGKRVLLVDSDPQGNLTQMLGWRAADELTPSLATITPQFYRGDDTPEKRLDRQKQYIDTIHEVRSVMEGLRTREDALRAFDQILIANGYVQKTAGISGPHDSAAEKGRENPAATDKLVQALYVPSAACPCPS